MPTGTSKTALLVTCFVLLAACAAPTRVASVHMDDAYANSSFNNILVIGVAGNYNSRAQFERTAAAGIRAAGVSAGTYYSVVQGNDPISREAVLAAVQSGGFDAVLVTRVVDQRTDINVESGSIDTKASTVGGRPVNFFRYDYEELNEPESINFSTTIVLSSELFSATDEKMIWAIEISKTDAPDAGTLIDDTAASIVARLRSDGLIGR